MRLHQTLSPIHRESTDECCRDGRGVEEESCCGHHGGHGERCCADHGSGTHDGTNEHLNERREAS